MPITTEHFMLEAFLDGDSYSALADKRRFSTIDNQMHAMTEIMGEGRIDGWEIIPLAFPNIRITQGSGFIDGHYVVTFSDEDFELAANGTFFAYAQRRVGILGTVGPRSNVVSVTYVDSGAPVAPSGFAADTPTASGVDPFFNVQLTWASNTEVDFDHYDIERATSPSALFVLIDSVEDGTNAYVDSVDEDTSFTYHLFAVDESGFRSPAATAAHSTGLSPNLPSDPSEVTMPASEGAINVLWKRPFALAFSKVASWNLTWVRLKSDGSEIAATQQTKTVSRLEFRDRIDNLINGEAYRITLKTVDNKGRLSGGVSRDVIPQLLTSPKDPESISVVETELVTGSVVLNFTWADGADEYDPLIPHSYRIYVTVDGQQESQPIFVPIGESEETVELYTFNGFNFFSIPQNTLVTFRLTSLSQNGIESLGNYVRFITKNFAIPNAVAGLAATFNPDIGNITVTWVNPSGISNITMKVTDDDLGDEYPSATLVNKSIGLIEQFIFDAELNHSYVITATPVDANGVSGPANVIVEVTILPGGFPSPIIPHEIFPQSGDRQISFSWTLSTSLAAASYNIYRKIGVVSVIFADWVFVDNVPKTKPEFTDYGLDNDQVYSYYITAVDIYGQESLHLTNGAVNLNFFESIPRASGILTEPADLQAVLTGDDILMSWDSLLEEFDAFTVYRSTGNLHSWQDIADIDRNNTSFLDLDLKLVSGTTFYYTVGKTINDSDIVVQASNVAPESSILLGSITLDGSSFSTPDVSGRRDIKDMVDPLSEYTNTRVLAHRHRGLQRFDPERIDLNPQLIITDWETVDGRIFTTSEIDISGTGHLVKINGRFPTVLFEIDQSTNRLIFTEAIVSVDEFGNVIGDLPNIEVRVLGVEEIQGILNANRFDKIHARQVTFGRLNKEQMPSINHEGRIRERLLPKSYLLERFSNHSFIVPQGNTDNTKTFGNGTSFYATIESDGLIKEIIDWDQEDDGDIVGFNKPSQAIDTLENLQSLTLGEATPTHNASEYTFTGEFFALKISGSDLFSFSRTTLAVENIGVGGGLAAGDTIAISTSNNIVYVSPHSKDIYSLDLVTGFRLLLGGVAGTIDGLAFDNTNNILYAILDNLIFATIDIIDFKVVELNPSDRFEPVLHPRFYALAYDENTNTLFAAGSRQPEVDRTLWTVNVSTGLATEVTTGEVIGTNSLGGMILTMTFDHSNNMLYGIGEGTTLTEIIPTGATAGRGTALGDIYTNTHAIEAPPTSTLWLTNPRHITMGNSGGLNAENHLRFRVNFEPEDIVQVASLKFHAHDVFPSTGNVSLRVSVLDPSQYADAITLETEAIKTVALLSSIIWNPSVWSLDENGANTSVDVRTLIQNFVNSPSYTQGRHVIFRIEVISADSGANRIAFSVFTPSKAPALDLSTVIDRAEVTSDQAFQSEKSYRLVFSFEDASPTRWIRVTTANAPIKPNPIVDLKKRIRFKVLLESVSVYLSLGIRELPNVSAATTGDNGGIVGPVEWVGVSEVITDLNGNSAPLGKLISAQPGVWQEIEFDLEQNSVQPFSSDSNGLLGGTYGVLEHFAFTVFPGQSNPTGPISIFIDKLQQVDDVLTAGTSQGIQISRDFGTSWEPVRLVETPVHKFYKASNNPFIWALATNTVLIAVDPASWFETSGLTGVQYIRDIAEDEFGNMFISTDKGVFWFEIALINNFSSWRQTQPITAFTTDCYGLYHNAVSSGLDEIWVSTEIGIFKTVDFGATWTDTDMNTQGLPAYEFINISSNSLLPNIVTITRKHVLRKLGSEANFSILANMEVQHKIFNIWKMEHFSGHIYISTEKGVYWNSVDELFDSGINTTFDRILPGLDINGQVAIAFGLDSVAIQGGATQLFIGQENRIMMADELNVLSIKEQFPNKELPSFFADGVEITSGYVYNSFNNVLAFREPQPVGVLYTSANIPRKFYIPANKGWAQTNPSADVFIHFNGIPKWLDFKLDESAILSELQTLQGKLAPIAGTLTDFNSLRPTASDTLTIVLANINNMIRGGEAASPLVNNTTIIKFLQDYTRFLSLITTAVINANGLGVFPKFNVAGFPANQRETESIAATLEAKENFTANNSTGININTFTGEIDFLTAFTAATTDADKQEFVFGKYDKMNITVFKSNVSNTGEFSHRELEDQMESVNTGLSSHMSRSHYTNMIKAGIFMETNHPFLFETHNASNVQSKYNSAHNSAWYDILNSTVDYKLLLKVDKGEESRFSNAMVLFTENPYLLDRIWVATDNDIMQYQLDTVSGELAIEKSVRPGSGIFSLFIWDVFVFSEDDIYVVAEEQDSKVGHIFRTIDSGVSWTDLATINIPQKIYTFTILNGNKIVGTENGIFFSDNNFGTWFPANLTLSPQLNSNSPTVAAFTNRVRNIETSTFLIAESEKWFYTSGGGLDWVALAGQITTNGVTAVNKVHRFKNITWVGTDKGLYNDGNSILSDGVQFGLQTELEDSSSNSAKINVSDITTGVDALYCCAGDKVYRFLDDVWKSHTVIDVTSIHKIAIRETSGKHFLIIVSHNVIKVVDVTDGSGVFG